MQTFTLFLQAIETSEDRLTMLKQLEYAQKNGITHVWIYEKLLKAPHLIPITETSEVIAKAKW